MRNIKLLIEYDGTNYVGWQRQENGRSIQGEIESVLAGVLQETVSVNGAGRTDAGVHARGQVANFQTGSDVPSDKIAAALNGLLPDDIVIHSVVEVPLDFHARYSAKARRYSYNISLQPTALQRHYAWYLKYNLDINAMRTAAEKILGRHDFSSYCKTGSDVEHCFCTVHESKWTVTDTGLQYRIQADRFLRGMVRALVGTMVDVGRGYTTLDEFNRILEAKDRKRAGMAAPAKGLVLEEVI